MLWLPFPFLRITFFFIIGILLGIYFPDTFSWPYVVFVLVIGAAFYTLIVLRGTKGREIIIGVLGLFIILVAGYFRSINFTDSQNKDHLINFKGTIECYTAILCSSPEEKNDFWKVVARIERVRTAGAWKLVTGNVQLYFPKKDFPVRYKYGDKILSQGIPQVIPPPGNPGEFDYKRFQKFKNIYHQQFLKKNNVKFIDHRDYNPLLSLSFAARQWANGVFVKYIQPKEERTIASALVLGVTDGLDRELLNAYASTGTLHVLSVSGLHVSIIYFIMVSLFKPVRNYRTGRWILAISSVLILWSYAFITGLSPSVLRAVTMFSFVALSNLMSRRSNIYNTLAMSAFCLLLFDPFMIMSIGFQLSYLAVFGIVYLQPSIYRWYSPDSKFLDEVWKITSVSLAAQVATFELGLLCFNQFPNYFWLSNLFVIPASFVVLVSGLALLAFDFIQPIAFYIGIFMEWVIRIMDYIIVTIEKFPYNLVENVHLNPLQFWLLTGALITIILLVKVKRYSYAVCTAALLILFSVSQWFDYTQSYCKSKITIYNIPHHSAIDLSDRGHAYFIADDVLVANVQTIKFHIAPNRLLNGVSVVEHIRDESLMRDLPGCRLIHWNGKTILQIVQSGFSVAMPMPINIDYILISNNAYVDLVGVMQYIRFKKMIIDSSNSFYFANKLLEQALKQKINIHSTRHSGAFVVDI